MLRVHKLLGDGYHADLQELGKKVLRWSGGWPLGRLWVQFPPGVPPFFCLIWYDGNIKGKITYVVWVTNLQYEDISDLWGHLEAKKGNVWCGNRTHDLLCHSNFAYRSAFLPKSCGPDTMYAYICRKVTRLTKKSKQFWLSERLLA